MKSQFKNLIGRTRIFQIALIAGIAVFAMSCETADTKEMVPNNQSSNETAANQRMGAPMMGSMPIAQIAIDNNFNELVGALVYVDNTLNAGLVDLFMNGKDQYTVFAPTDAAFQALYASIPNVDEITDLPANVVLDVLLYHVVEGRRAANSVVPRNNPKNIETLLGTEFTVSSTPSITTTSNGTAGFVATDISASNGIIHVIDAVLMP